MRDFKSIHLFCLVFVCFSACNWNKRWLEKRIPVEGDIWVELSLLSDITFDQEWLEFVNTKSNERQLIYKGPIICTFELNNKELKIFIEGSSYVKFQPDNDYNIKVVLDTTCRSPSLYKKEMNRALPPRRNRWSQF